MKKILLITILSLFSFFELFSQNGLIGKGFGTDDWNTTDNFSESAGTSRIGTFTANGTGNQYFRTVINWDGNYDQYTINNGSDVSISAKIELTPNQGPTTSGAMYLNVPSTSNNYIFKTENGGANPSHKLIVFEVQGTVRNVSSVSKDKVTVYQGQSVTVTANLDGAFSTGQSVYLRYTTDNFANSTIVEMTGSGTTYTADIPALTNTAAASVSYYVFTSGDGLTISHSNADWYTINLNNGGSNYSYTVNSSFITAQAGDWGTAATWVGGVPISGASVVIDHNVTLDQAATVSSLTINSGKGLSGESSTLTISSGGTFTNNGIFTAGTGKVSFEGAGTVSGTVTFNNVDIAGGVNFGFASTINGTLTVKAGGFVNTNAPTYGGTSTLLFNTGGEYTIDGSATIWATGSTVGKGVPANVIVSTTTPLNIYEARDVTGNLTINSGASIVQGNNGFTIQGNFTNAGTFSFVADGVQPLLVKGDLLNQNGATITLSNEIGGDMHLEGDYQSSGTIAFNNRAIFFKGGNAQSVTGTNNPINFDYLFIEKDAATTLTFDQNVNINNTFDQSAGNATIASGKTLTIGVSAVADIALGTTLTTNGNLIIGSNATGTGSLIVNGTVSGNVTVERYIPAPSGTGGSWDNNYGWRLLSSPVVGQSISAFTVEPATNYDFYLWNESSDLWMNYKAGDWNSNNTDNLGASQSGNFALGRGYMAAYAAVQTGFSFTGTLTTENVVWSNLSFTGTGIGEIYDKGWHILGNPFSSALTWNVGSWALSNVAITAKIWDEASRAYVDVASDGLHKHIPAAQGFLVQVSSGTNSITIPTDARTHQSATWYKSNSFNGIVLVARESQDTKGQESNIIISENAFSEFEFQQDSRFFAGYAPTFYSIFSEEKISTKRLPSVSEETVIPFGFIKNNASSFAIELKESSIDYPIFLTDNKTGTIHKLSENPVYTFTSEEGDSPDRFLLHFGVVGIGEQDQATTLNAYAYNNRLYVNNSLEQAQIAVYDLQGRLLMQQSANTSGLQSLPLDLPTGVYVVQLSNAQEAKSVKINVQ